VTKRTATKLSRYIYSTLTMTVTDSFSLAYRTIKSNRVRTFITVTIIALGIAALIFIITVIESMNSTLRENFSTMGANAFNIRFKESRGVQLGNSDVTVTKGRKPQKATFNKAITQVEAEDFKAAYTFPAPASLYLRGPGGVTAYYQNKKTNPQITIWGGDENYLPVVGYTLSQGRNFSRMEVESGNNVCLIGNGVYSKLFAEMAENPIDKIIRIGNVPYRVIGLLKSKGSSSFLRQDDVIITTYRNARKLKGSANTFFIGVNVTELSKIDNAISEAEKTFRAVRRLSPIDDNNFAIEKSDKLAETFISALGNIQGSASAIGLVTLIGAAIGLMNIMLVAVSERTREIGLIKAIGGKRSHIRQQFLFESILISIFGAVVGIILGVSLGFAAATILHAGFVMPWAWVAGGIAICAVVGLFAGLYPAIKAAKLNPINALGYE